MQRFARGNIRGTLQNVCLTGGNWGLQLSLDSWDWQLCQSHPHLPIWSCLRCHFGDTLKTHRFVRTLQLDGQGNVQNSECLKSLWACLGKMIKARLFLWKNLRFLSQVLACIEHSCQCLPEHVLQCYVLQQTSTEMNQENHKRDFFARTEDCESPVSQYLDSKLTSCANKLCCFWRDLIFILLSFCWSQELSGQCLLCQFSSGSNRWWFAGSSASYHLKIGCSADDFHDFHQFFASCSFVLPR